MDKLKQWYNGYTWDMKTWVYNPYSVLNFMDTLEFENYWYETGTPYFLFKELKKQKKYVLENVWLGKEALTNFFVGNKVIDALLFR